MILQEYECILERWRWHCAYVCVSGRGVSWWMCFWLVVVEEWCWPESVDATNTMDNADIMNKWFAYRIKIYVNKNDGVAGEEPAETLAESVHAQQEVLKDVTVRHTLNYSPCCCSRPSICALEGKTGYGNRVVTTHASNITPLGMKVHVIAEQRIGAAHFCAKYVRVSSTWWLKSCVCDQRETGVRKRAPPPFLCAATALAKA